MMLQDTWGTHTTKGSWGVQSWGQRLNTEAAYSSLPDVLESQSIVFLGFG